MSNHEKSIEAERAKSYFSHNEDIRPGVKLQIDLKSIIFSTHSEYQKIQVIESAFGKVLITDGKTQSAQVDEHVYHESLVHPSLVQSGLLSGIMSPDKQGEQRKQNLSVFIGGGGELATAREVLRHKSVDRVVMVDLDKTVVDVCKKYLPEWGGDEVLSNPRFELIVGDAYKYLTECKEKFDVIIMDISDPIEAGPGIMLYTKEFYDHAKTLLNDPNGVFVTQAGYAGQWEESDSDVCFAPIINTLQSTFEHVVPYSTYIPSFGSPWGFVMAFGCSPSGSTTNLSSPSSAITNVTRMEPDLIDKIVSQNIMDINDDLKNDKNSDDRNGSEILRFYDGISHLAMFSLTKPIRQAIEKDSRIMTKDNPIFMY